MLSKPDLEKAEKVVAEWKPHPTPLTIKAKQGVSAAEALVKTANK